MADGTLRGSFELDASQPIRDLHTIRDAGYEGDRALATLGRRMDEIGRKRVTPRIELSGFDRVNAQLSELEARLDRLDHRRAVAHVGVGGGLGGGGPSLPVNNQTGGRFPLFSSLGGIGGRLPWWSAAVPFAGQLAGGAGALGASAGSAALGAGVLGLGGAASLGPGGIVSAMLGKNAVKDLQAVTKAQTTYNEAVQAFGARSTQAAAAKRRLDMALVSAPPGAAGAARQVAGLTSAFRTATRPGYQAIYGGIAQGASSFRQALPSVAPLINTSAGVTARAGADYAGFLSSPQSIASYRQMTGAFAQELPIVERSLQSVTRLFFNLGTAAIPFFHEANVWVNNWTRGLANQSQDTARVQRGMQGMVDSGKQWMGLLSASGRLLKDLFAPGVKPGDSMVGSLTNTLDRWDQWLSRNPDKVRKFFTDSEQGVGRIASVLGNLAHDIWQIFQALSPILTRAEQFLKFASGLGGGSLLLGGSLLYGGYKGARGALGGRGPSAGGLLGSFILGSPGVAMRSGGGGAAAGGVGPVPMGAGPTSRTFLVPGAGTPFATRGGVAGEIATPEAFHSAYGAVPGARYGLPVSELGAEASAIGKAGTALRGFAAGAGRLLVPLAGLSAVLGALQPTTGGPLGRLQNAASAATFGLVSPYQDPRQTHIAAASTLLQNIQGMSPQAQRAAISTALAPGGAFVPTVGQFSGARGQNAQAIMALSSARIQAYANVAQSPQDLHTINREIGNLRLNLAPALSPGARRQLEASLRQVWGSAVQNVGAGVAGQWQNALTRGFASMGPNKAIRTALGGITTELRSLGPQGGRAFASDMAQWARQETLADPKLEKPIQKLMDGITDRVNRMNHHVTNSFKDLQAKVFYFNGQILDGSTKTWQAISTALTDPAQVAQEKLSGIWGQIQSEAADALTKMGYSPQQARQIVTLTAKGGQGKANANFAVGLAGTKVGGTTIAPTPLSPGGSSGLPKKERGGAIPGSGLLDTMNVGGALAAPGEAWIANRHTMNALSSATLARFGKTAWQMIRDEDRPHSWPMGGSRTGRAFATGGLTTSTMAGSLTGIAGNPGTAGGYVYPIPGYSVGRTDMGVDASATAGSPILAIGDSTLTGVRQNWYKGQPLLDFRLNSGPMAGRYWYVAEQISPTTEAIGSTFSAGQAVGRFAPSGTGIEIGWAGNASGDTLAQTTTGYSEGQVTPAGTAFRNFIMGLSHGRLVAGGPGAGGAAVNPISLKAPRTGLRGIPGAMGDQASRIMARGLQDKVNARIGAGAAAGRGGGGGMATASWFDDPTTASGRVHIPGFAELSNPPGSLNFSAMGGLPMGELVNFWGPGWSITIPKVDKGAGGPGLGGKVREADFTREAAAEIPGMLGAGLMNINWRDTGRRAFERGGRWAGWNARGGEFVTHGPTLFGAGEKGREHVSITPAGHAGRQINVHFNGPVYARDEHEVEALGEMVAGKILDAIDGVGQGTSDSELQGVSG